MKHTVVNAIGEACPIPVVKAKKEIEAQTEAAVVDVQVDNDAAVENLKRMASSKGLTSEVKTEVNGSYTVSITVPAGQGTGSESEEEVVCVLPDRTTHEANTVVAITSEFVGTGDDKLGAILMKSFLFALRQQDVLPKTILFYNGGAKVSAGDSEAIEDLKALEEAGVEIFTCGTCLDFYGIKDQLKVGGVTNMYDIIERQMKASHVIRP